MEHYWLIGAIFTVISLGITVALALRRVFVFRSEFNAYKGDQLKWCKEHRKACVLLHQKDLKLQEKDLEMKEQDIKRLEEKIEKIDKKLCKISDMLRSLLIKNDSGNKEK